MTTRLATALLLSAVMPGFAACSQPNAAGATGTVAQRRTMLLRQAVSAPFPSPDCTADSRACINGQLTQALAMLALGDRSMTAAANAEVARALAGMAGDLQTAERLSPEEADIGKEETAQSFHFIRAALLYRMMRAYGPAASGGNGVLAAPVAETILTSFQRWSAANCRVADTAPAAIWTPWKSENHDAQRTGACWAAADLMRRVPRYAGTAYPDGSRPADQYARWSGYVIRYLDQHAHHGTIEFFSPTYTSYALSPVYGYADYSDDPALRQAARSYLDLWWTQWAESSVRGCFGGAENRAYPSQVRFCPMGPVAWMYFGQGEQQHDAPGFAAALASGYAPPRLAADLAGDPARRGSFETFARSPGFRRDGDAGRAGIMTSPAILRIGYVTPTFVVGTPVVARMPASSWNLGAVQNVRAAVRMTGRDQLVAFEPQAAGRGSAYNGLWGLQSRGTQVLAMAPPPFAKNVRTLRMFVGAGLTSSTRDGWTFLEGAAFTAIKPLVGGVHPDAADDGWLVFDTPNEPIVVQTSPKSLYPSLAAFQAAVLRLPISGGGGRVTVQGLDGAERIDFSTDPRALGHVNGRTIDPRGSGPALVGPFVKMAGAGGAITIGSATAFPAER